MDFILEQATSNDDAALRHLLSSNPMPGTIALTYEREPSYFAGAGILNREHQVLIARHLPTGQIAGVACRAVRSLFVNGQETQLGYISQLRIAPQFQGRWLVARGRQLFMQLHAQGAVPAYLSSIIEGNELARRLFVERRRRGFPTLHPVGRLVTLAMMLPGRGRRPAGSAVSGQGRSPAGSVLPGLAEDRGEIVAFLREHGRHKQFFPALAEGDFDDHSLLPGLSPQDFLLVRRAGRIVGTLALWDQSGCKQTVVSGYNGWMRWARLPYNAIAPLLGVQGLPPPGTRLRQIYGSFICIRDDDPQLFAELLQAAVATAARHGHGYLVIGLTETDPLLKVARTHRHIPYLSRLYLTAWEDGEATVSGLDRRVPYMELASL